MFEAVQVTELHTLSHHQPCKVAMKLGLNLCLPNGWARAGEANVCASERCAAVVPANRSKVLLLSIVQHCAPAGVSSPLVGHAIEQVECIDLFAVVQFHWTQTGSSATLKA